MISQRLRGMEEDGSAIEGLIPKIQSAFDKYTKGAVSVIDKQNGGLNSTYEILQQLSKVYPTLSDEAKAYINEVVAGNRQNKVLVSILENWQNVEKAVQSATNSLGSANSENEKFLNSIQGRMSQLSSSTEMFWKNFIDSELIKEGVDTLNSLVQIMDTLVNNSFSEFLIQAGLISATFILMNKGAKALGDSLTFTAIKVTLLDIAEKGLLATTKALTVTMLASPLFWVIAGFAIIKAIDALTTSLKEQKEIVETLNSELQMLQSEYDSLKANPDRTEEQTKYLGLLEKELEIKKELLKIETKKAIDKEFFTNYLPTANDAKSYNPTTKQIEYGDTSGIGKINESVAKLIELQNELSNDPSKEVYDVIKEKILKLEQSLTSSLKTIQEYSNIMGDDMPVALLELSSEIESALGLNNDLINSNNNVNKSFNDTIIDLTNLHKSLAKTLNDSRSEISDINDALHSYNESGKFSSNQISKLVEQYPQLLSVLHNEKKLYEELKKIQKEKVTETQKAFNSELEILKTSINEKARGYEIDFNNYKSLEETKLKISKDMVDKVIKEYDRIYDATGDDQKAEIHARKTRKRLVESFGNVIPEIDAYLNLQKFDVGKFITGVDGKDKDKFISDLEVRYRFLQATIDSLNKTLDINQEKLNQTDSEVNKISILKQQIEIYKQLQIAMQNMNTERRKEREEIIKQLQNSGISSAKIIDDVGIITDLKQISNLTGESGKKIEELVKRLDSSNSSIRQGSMEWWKYQSSITGATNEIDNLIKAIQEAEEKALKEMFDAISDVESKIIQIIKKRGEIEREELEKSHKADMESLEERHKAKMDSYKEELESFRKMIQGQIDELDRQYAEEDYMKQLQEERDKATEIQRQIDVLSLDDSLEARNKTIELRKELADQNEKIADMQTKRERDLLKQNLQDQLKDKEEYIRKQEEKENSSYERSKQKLENTYSNNKDRLDREYSDYQVYIEAKQALEDGYVLDFEGKMVSLEEAYVKFEDRFGAGLGILGEKIKSDFIAQIEEAIKAVKKLQNMSISVGSSGGGGKSGGSSSGGGSISNMSDSDLQKYLNYKEIWDMADKTGNETAKKEANKAAQALRDKYGIKSDDYSYEELKKKGYKVGGVIDYTGDAMVHGSKTSAEVVFSASDAKKLWEYVKALPTVPTAQIPKVPYGAGSGLGNIVIENLIGKVEGSLDKSAIPDIYKTVKVAINEVFDARKRELDKRGQIVFR